MKPMDRQKRVREKLHRRFLDDVACAVRMSSEWRVKLFAAAPPPVCFYYDDQESFEVRPNSLPGLGPRLPRFGLTYRVAVVSGLSKAWAVAEIWAAEFPHIRKDVEIFGMRERTDSPIWRYGSRWDGPGLDGRCVHEDGLALPEYLLIDVSSESES